MTVDTFLANFGHLADAPNGVRKLRELILQLAVQGKLVPQDLADEPAAKLLERIQKEKAGSGSRRGGSRTAPAVPVNLDEMPYELPQAWEWVRFGDIAQHNAGKTLDKARNTGQLRDYITTSNLYWGFFDLNNVRQMPIEDDELDRCTAQKGDLLIVEGGEAGRAAVWTKDYDVCFQNHVHRARFYCDVDPFYVYRFFEKLNLSGEIGQYRKGVGISNMSGKALASIVLPLPPLAEQHRIVAKVDQLMALCDELEARQRKQQEGRARLNNAVLDALLNAGDVADFAAHWQRICTNFDLLYDHPDTISKLRAAILQLAVQGKLVPQDLRDEPVGNLLEKVKVERRKNGFPANIKSGKSDLISDARLSAMFPTQWHMAELADIALAIVDCPHSTPKWTEKGKLCVRTNQFKPGRLDLADSRCVSEQTYIKRIERLRPQADDILYSREGGILGVACRVPENVELCLGQRMMLFRSSFCCIPEFLELVLNSPMITEIAREQTTGGAAPRVNVATVKSYPIPVPSIKEQKHIVDKVDQLMALCDALEDKLNQTRQQSENLMEASVRQLLV